MAATGVNSLGTFYHIGHWTSGVAIFCFIVTVLFLLMKCRATVKLMFTLKAAVVAVSCGLEIATVSMTESKMRESHVSQSVSRSVKFA